jgi:hypothetical protein
VAGTTGSVADAPPPTVVAGVEAGTAMVVLVVDVLEDAGALAGDVEDDGVVRSDTDSRIGTTSGTCSPRALAVTMTSP